MTTSHLIAPLLLGKLEASLRDSSRSFPVALAPKFGSYRGIYSQVAVAPGTSTAGELLDALVKFKAKGTMEGYKGGEYPIKDDCFVFVAQYGDLGHMLVDFTQWGDTLVPILFDSDDLWRLFL